MKTTLTLLLLHIFFFHSLLAQVTIGSGIKPESGALIDFKENNPTEENITSTKGVLLPRVKLQNVNSLIPIFADGGTIAEKKMHIGLQLYHVGGNNIEAGVKVWNGTSWGDLDNANLNVGNGLDYATDTLKLGGDLTQNTQVKAIVEGANFEYNSMEDNANFLITGKAKLGINTTNPSANLDVNGTVRIGEIPTVADENTKFTFIGVDESGNVVKENDAFSSFTKYLGFDPMALEHTVVLPFSLDSGYIYQIEGMTVGACYGVIVNFKIYFIGDKYLGATLQAIASSKDDVYAAVVLPASKSIFGTPLEVLANASTCSKTSGHTLTYLPETRQIKVAYYDVPKYFPDAGTFVITNFSKFKN